MRHFFVQTHRWIAIVASLFLLGIAAGGAALVFEGAIRARSAEGFRFLPS